VGGTPAEWRTCWGESNGGVVNNCGRTKVWEVPIPVDDGATSQVQFWATAKVSCEVNRFASNNTLLASSDFGGPSLQQGLVTLNIST
jgi:hypothetical protein